jgi:hypothetical protein
MNEEAARLRASAIVMHIVGWSVTVGLVVLILVYPPGFLWGEHLPGLPRLGPAHPPSPFDAFHPYLFMLGALYGAYGILLIRGAKDPRAASSLFDFGILSSILHGLVMIPQSFYYPNEHAHLWADVPLLFVLAAVLWRWHPNRIARRADGG